MRKAKGIAAIFAGLLLMFRAGAITVSADEGKGNNGDVKIHATGTLYTDNRNEPHVCSFYIEGFKFDKGQTGSWVIVGQAPTAGNAGATGSWGPANKDGNWFTSSMTLADGHYKLTVNTGKGDGKHKVFWVECAPKTAGQANTTPVTNGGNNGGQQNNNGSNGSSNGERSSIPTNSKSKAGGSKSGTNSKSKKGGSATGTNSASKGTKASNGASVASQGNNASGTNSLQTVSREEATAPATTAPNNSNNNNEKQTGTPAAVGGTVTVPAGGQMIPTTTIVPAGTTITIPVAVTLPGNSGTLAAGVVPTGTTLPAGTTLPEGTTITGVLGFESAPAMTGAVTPELEGAAAAASQLTAVGGEQTSPQLTAVNGEQTSPVAGVTSLPSTSTLADNGIWGALGLMLAGLGAFLLRKPQRRLN